MDDALNSLVGRAGNLNPSDFEPLDVPGERIRYQIDGASNETDFILCIILYCPSPIVDRGWTSTPKVGRSNDTDGKVSSTAAKIIRDLNVFLQLNSIF